MKKSTLVLWVLSLLTLSGCGAVKGLMTYTTDSHLKGITEVHALPAMNSIGFEWQKIEDKDVYGVNIYRSKLSENQYNFKRIGTVNNRYATHFVDIHVNAETSYYYSFSTLSLGKESKRSAPLKVKTLATFLAVSFVKAYKVAPSVVKLLWKPHTNASVNAYIVQRSVNGGKWQFLSQVKGQLMVEYIDTFVRSGNTYRYRIIAQSYDKIRAHPSNETQITL